MTGNIRLLKPGSTALVEVGSFQDDQSVHDGWAPSLPPGHKFLSDHYWRFTEDPETEAAKSVGILMFGLMVKYPEFKGLGSCITGGFREIDEIRHEMGLLAVCKSNSTPFVNPDRTTATLIEATNEHLLALNSPYHLPLD